MGRCRFYPRHCRQTYCHLSYPSSSAPETCRWSAQPRTRIQVRGSACRLRALAAPRASGSVRPISRVIRSSTGHTDRRTHAASRAGWQERRAPALGVCRQGGGTPWHPRDRRPGIIPGTAQRTGAGGCTSVTNAMQAHSDRSVCARVQGIPVCS